MNKITLEATECTPKVLLDHIDFKFEIKGESSPEDAKQFYSPFLKWIDDFGNYLHFLYTSNPGTKKRDITFEFHMDYVTSSSLKNIYDMLVKIESLRPHTDNLKVKWIYDKGDEDMQDNGLEFSKMLKVPFEVVSA